MAHALFEPVAFVDPHPPENFMGLKLVPKGKMGNFHNPIHEDTGLRDMYLATRARLTRFGFLSRDQYCGSY